MAFFMLSQKKEVGCPVGLLSAALYDRFYENAKSLDHGAFPWYANAALGKPHEVLPSGLVLIANAKKYDFTIRALYDRLYVASEGFVKVCRELGVTMLDCQKIDVVSGLNKGIVASQYYVVVFESSDYGDLVLPSSQVAIGVRDWVTGFERLNIKEDAPDLFKLNKLHPGISTLFCSSDFKAKLVEVGVRGVEILPLPETSSQELEAI
ncbi:Imm43 family immunity protein [Pseudomonas sichuanensis]|uniref:Immunity protein 43 domain-containing protein n=1 Tax=Pseudomonas sichuanensis TaxID=2213015 RepID=A0ABV0DEZ7_9PSED